MKSQQERVKEQVWREIRSRHPPIWEAILADAKITARYRGERHRFRSRKDALLQVARLCWVSDAFLAVVLYRLKAGFQRKEVPILPRICHRLAMATAQVSIGDPVVVQPGVYIVHGQIVLDGLVEIGSGTVIAPWVSIGLRSGIVQGPRIGRNVAVGTGSTLLGPFEVGDGAQIGANSVVLSDVEAGATVVSNLARPLAKKPVEEG